jgi:hypothetical protein
MEIPVHMFGELTSVDTKQWSISRPPPASDSERRNGSPSTTRLTQVLSVLKRNDGANLVSEKAKRIAIASSVSMRSDDRQRHERVVRLKQSKGSPQSSHR